MTRATSHLQACFLICKVGNMIYIREVTANIYTVSGTILSGVFFHVPSPLILLLPFYRRNQDTERLSNLLSVTVRGAGSQTKRSGSRALPRAGCVGLRERLPGWRTGCVWGRRRRQRLKYSFIVWLFLWAMENDGRCLRKYMVSMTVCP